MLSKNSGKGLMVNNQHRREAGKIALEREREKVLEVEEREFTKWFDGERVKEQEKFEQAKMSKIEPSFIMPELGDALPVVQEPT